MVNLRMLAALKKTSFRETEFRHLDDLKRRVCEPLIAWLDDEVTKKLGGRSPFIIDSFERQTPKDRVTIGEDPFDRRMEIRESLSDPAISPMVLYFDAKASHFSLELTKFENLQLHLRTFAKDCASLGRRCANEIGSDTSLKRENLLVSNQEGGDPDALVVD